MNYIRVPCFRCDWLHPQGIRGVFSPAVIAEILQHTERLSAVITDRIHVYKLDDSALTKRHGEMEWLPRIRQALHESQFCLYHQLIVPLAENNDEQHHEILLRMKGPDNRIIPPGVFIPAAGRVD